MRERAKNAARLAQGVQTLCFAALLLLIWLFDW